MGRPDRKAALVLALAVGLGTTLAATSSFATRPTGDGATERSPKVAKALAGPVARARAATAKYVHDLDLAKADGYRPITPMIPDMGYHFLNPAITEFDVEQPPILVYERNGDDWQLAAFEWVFPERPDHKPLPGARYGSFGAACHYDDGTFVFEDDESACAATSPETGAPFFFWHPDLVTLHVWAWYPNPDGLYASMNRWVRPFNDDQV